MTVPGYAAIVGARAIRERYWRAVAKAEGIPADDRYLWVVAAYSGGKRRAATAAELAGGIPVGWIGR